MGQMFCRMVAFVAALVVLPSVGLGGLPPPPKASKGHTEALEDTTTAPAPEYVLTGSLRVWSWFAAGDVAGGEIDGTGSTSAVRLEMVDLGVELGTYNPGGYFYVMLDSFATRGYHATEIGEVQLWVLYPTMGVGLLVGGDVVGFDFDLTGTGLRATYCTAVCLLAEVRVPTLDLLVNPVNEVDDVPMAVAWGTSMRMGLFF